MSLDQSMPAFALLPSELRLKIWSYLLPSPRVVPIRFNHTAKTYITITNNASMSPACQHPLALLGISSETRELFLQHYTPLLLSPKYQSSIYVDFTIDRLFFEHEDCSPDGDLVLDLASSPHRDRIQQVAIDTHLWEILRVFRYDCLSEIQLLKNLRSVALVLRKDNDEMTDNRSNGMLVSFLGMQRDTTGEERDEGSFGVDIRNAYWSVENMRWDLIHHEPPLEWCHGLPNVQMWLW